jgi:hypothetical protein
MLLRDPTTHAARSWWRHSSTIFAAGNFIITKTKLVTSFVTTIFAAGNFIITKTKLVRH